MPVFVFALTNIHQRGLCPIVLLFLPLWSFFESPNTQFALDSRASALTRIIPEMWGSEGRCVKTTSIKEEIYVMKML
jgi:hypothetical protein